MPSPVPLPDCRALLISGGRREAECGLCRRHLWPLRAANSSEPCRVVPYACHLSATVFGWAGNSGRPQQGAEELKIQSRWFKSILQMSNWLPSPLAWPHGPPAGDGRGSCSGLSTPLSLQKQVFKKTKAEKKAKSVQAAVAEVGRFTEEARGGEAAAAALPRGRGRQRGSAPGLPSAPAGRGCAPPPVGPSVGRSVGPSPHGTALLHASCYSACALQTRLPQSGSVILHWNRLYWLLWSIVPFSSPPSSSSSWCYIMSRC